MAFYFKAMLMFAMALFMLGIIFLFAWQFWFKKMFYRISKRKEIDMVYNLLRENENNPHFQHSHDRVEHYIKAGFHNPLVIELAEREFNADKPIRLAKKFIFDAIEQGYSLEEARELALKSGYKKKTIKFVFKINKQEKQNGRKENTRTETPRIEKPHITTEIRTEPIPNAKPKLARVEPRADAGDTKRDRVGGKVAGQRVIPIRAPESPVKKSRYFD